MLMLESIILSSVTQQLLFHQRYVVAQVEWKQQSFHSTVERNDTQSHRPKENNRSERTSGGHLIQSRTQSRASCKIWLGFLALPCQRLKISKDRYYRASPGKPFQYSTTPAVNIFFLRPSQNSSCCNLWLSLCNSDNTQLHLLLSPHAGSKSGITSPFILLQSCLVHQALLCPNCLDSSLLHFLHYVSVSLVQKRPDVDSQWQSHFLDLPLAFCSYSSVCRHPVLHITHLPLPHQHTGLVFLWYMWGGEI